MHDKCAVRKFLTVRFVEAALSGSCDEAFLVKLIVNCVGTVLTRVKLRPDLRQAVVVGSPAFGAGTMAGRQRGRLVEEEQLRVAAGRHEWGPTPSAKLQATGDPSLGCVEAANRAGVIVKAPAVAVDEASLGGRDQISQRRHAVLTWHAFRLARARARPRNAYSGGPVPGRTPTVAGWCRHRPRWLRSVLRNGGSLGSCR